MSPVGFGFAGVRTHFARNTYSAVYVTRAAGEIALNAPMPVLSSMPKQYRFARDEINVELSA